MTDRWQQDFNCIIKVILSDFSPLICIIFTSVTCMYKQLTCSVTRVCCHSWCQNVSRRTVPLASTISIIMRNFCLCCTRQGNLSLKLRYVVYSFCLLYSFLFHVQPPRMLLSILLPSTFPYSFTKNHTACENTWIKSVHIFQKITSMMSSFMIFLSPLILLSWFHYRAILAGYTFTIGISSH